MAGERESLGSMVWLLVDRREEQWQEREDLLKVKRSQPPDPSHVRETGNGQRFSRFGWWMQCKLGTPGCASVTRISPLYNHPPNLGRITMCI